MTMKVDRQPRCRCRVGPGSFQVRARIERFAEPAVLVLLAEGASHGYELAERLEELVDEGRVDFGNLYRLLRALEEEGLVTSSWSEEAPGPQKRVYELTGEGASLLAAWVGSLRARLERIGALVARYEAVAARVPRGSLDSDKTFQENDSQDQQADTQEGGAP